MLRMRLRTGATGFSPGSLFAAGEQGGWYDPSDFSTMFQDNLGATPVTAVGQSVGKINDKSGRGNHLTQATAGSRPTIQQDAGGLYYLLFDGLDDSLASSAYAFGSDKATVVVGTRKTSDAASAVLVEFGANAATDNGAWGMFAPSGAAANNFFFRTRGTVAADAASAATYASPVSAVVTGYGDIAGDVSQVTVGSTTVTGATDQGTGNYGTYALNLGRRNNATVPFTGRVYHLIVRAGAISTTALSSAQSYVTRRTGS